MPFSSRTGTRGTTHEVIAAVGLALKHDGDFMRQILLTVEATDETPLIGKRFTLEGHGGIVVTPHSMHQQQGEEGRTLASIKPSTCRISCGIEDADDIIADLEAESCKSCHNSSRVEAFNFRPMLYGGAH